MSRHRSSMKKAPPEIGLYMECMEEDLEPSQVSYLSNAQNEYFEVETKLDQYIKKLKAEVIEKGEHCLVLQLNVTSNPNSNSFGPIPSSVTGKGSKQSFVGNQGYQQVVGSGILTRSTSSTSSSGNTFFVVDPGVSFMVGQISTPIVPSEQGSGHSKAQGGGKSRQSATSTPLVIGTRGKISSKRHTSSLTDSGMLSPPSTRARDKAKNPAISLQQGSLNSSQFIADQVYSNENNLTSCGNYILKPNAKPMPSPSKPAEGNALGGLTVGCKTQWKPIDEVSNNGGKTNADSREIAFSKVTGKTFPSLVVVARPHLKTKFIPQSKVAQERTALDGKVKGVLMYTATKFTEWLIQQGLIRSEQMCQNHINTDLSPVKLKLGMYSDISKFPYSGGYVWISDCCPSQFVSVFSGSIFEGAPHPPTTLLKLIYHWACQTNIQNIVQWVKVDNLYVKNFFTNMRAVCTHAVHEKYKKMGGPRKKIEVGVISLGTTSQDGNKRQVKVEVLGVMDFENKLVRLRAVEPHSDERSFKRRFVKILQPLEEWVFKESTILTDFTVNKAALNSMGFHTVFQVTSDVKYSNQNIMEYLRRIVPRMFQNTLSLLSRQIIQQFLDELVWREVWGPIPSQAFFTIIAHMAEQMKLDVNEDFLTRLSRIASNPFREWNYSVSTSQSHPLKPTSVSSSQQDPFSAGNLDFTSSQGKGTRARKRGGEQTTGEMRVGSPVPPSKKTARVSFKEKSKKKDPGECEERLSDEIVTFIQQRSQLSLENYYYGCLKGEVVTFECDNRSSAPFAVKCCVCNKRFTENIVLMKHMVLHCQVEPPLVANLKDVHQCESCFLGFNTADALKTHMERVHCLTDETINCEFLCHICERKFTGRAEHVFHMQKTHVEKELPYDCGVCRFRTSAYRLFVRHFVEAHKGEEYVFCPFCLKVVEVSHKSIPVTSNVLFYLSHLEKHHRSSLAKDCARCRLSFIHKGILKQHLEADHGTWKNEPGVESLPELFTGLLMPEPEELIKRESPVKFLKSQKISKNSFCLNKFKGLHIEGLDENSTCIECEEFLFSTNHFTGEFNCSKCRYGTCCERAMFEHWTVFHENASPRFTMGRPTVLENELFCACGFTSRSGNRMAKHLAVCEKRTGYGTLDSALAASQSVNDPQWTQGEGQKDVLNFLGLIRKSPEDGLDEESGKERGKENSWMSQDVVESNRVIDDANCGNAKPEEKPGEVIDKVCVEQEPDPIGRKTEEDEKKERQITDDLVKSDVGDSVTDESLEKRGKMLASDAIDGQSDGFLVDVGRCEGEDAAEEEKRGSEGLQEQETHLGTGSDEVGDEAVVGMFVKRGRE